jgi:hypothetical protein
MNYTQEIFFIQEEMNSHINSMGRQTIEIDFEQITVEKDYFYHDLDFKDKSAKKFIGDVDESTEIDSILNPLKSPFGNEKSSQISEENTETEEILAILRKKSYPANMPHSNYSRALSKSSPQFYEAKRIPLKGRVIECANSESKEDTGSPVTVSNFTLPIQSPVPIRPKCIPRRATTDVQREKFFSNREFCNELIMSKFEKKFNL